MDAIHIYCVDLGQLCEGEWLENLDDAEKQRALRISNRMTRAEFGETRAFLRLVLSKFLGRPPKSLKFETSAYGKPFLAGHNGVHFSVAHSAGKAMIAVGPEPVGIDVERVDVSLNHLDIAKSVFSVPELDVLTCLERTRQAEAFFSIWTRKEAYLKATGVGFASRPELISVVSPEGKVEDKSGDTNGSNWRSFNLPGSDQFAAALATRDSQQEVRIFDSEGLRNLLRDQVGPLKSRVFLGNRECLPWLSP